MAPSPIVAIRDALVQELDARRVSDGDSERDLHAADLTFHAPVRPDLVVYAETTADVVRVLELADEHRIPVTPYAAGSSLEGHVIPVQGGISLDLTRMDRIVEVRPDDLLAVVQPGVTRSALERAAGQHGLMFPVDPGADATLGGMAATNAAGTTTPRYGKMRPNVLALEAVLPGGRVIRTGSRAAKTSAGYDLTGLLVGSEGTLGVITELTLRLHGIPEHAVALRISFPTVEAASRTAVAAVAAGVGVTRARAARRAQRPRDQRLLRHQRTRSRRACSWRPPGRRNRSRAIWSSCCDRGRGRARSELVFEREPDARVTPLGGTPQRRLQLGAAVPRAQALLHRRLRAAVRAPRRGRRRARRRSSDSA